MTIDDEIEQLHAELDRKCDAAKDRDSAPMKPQYLDEVIRQAQAVEPGVYEVTILHDAWCKLLSGKGQCNCEPEVLPVGAKVGAEKSQRD